MIGLPNNLHEEAVRLSAAAGKAVLCTKPLGRNAAEAKRMLDMVEEAGVFGGYLVSIYKLGFNPSTYISNTIEFLEFQDVVSGLVKAAVFGLCMPQQRVR